MWWFMVVLRKKFSNFGLQWMREKSKRVYAVMKSGVGTVWVECFFMACQGVESCKTIHRHSTRLSAGSYHLIATQSLLSARKMLILDTTNGLCSCFGLILEGISLCFLRVCVLFLAGLYENFLFTLWLRSSCQWTSVEVDSTWTWKDRV